MVTLETGKYFNAMQLFILSLKILSGLASLALLFVLRCIKKAHQKLIRTTVATYR